MQAGYCYLISRIILADNQSIGVTNFVQLIYEQQYSERNELSLPHFATNLPLTSSARAIPATATMN